MVNLRNTAHEQGAFLALALTVQAVIQHMQTMGTGNGNLPADIREEVTQALKSIHVDEPGTSAGLVEGGLTMLSIIFADHPALPRALS